MKDSNSKQGRHFLSYTHKDEILVDDIIQQLTGLAKLQSQEKTGNAAFGAGLLHLVDALRPYANSPVAELPAMLRKFPPRRNSKPSHRKPKEALPPDLDSLGLDVVEKILSDENYTKQQLAELGHRRFGISRSHLTRLRKNDALASIRAALANERALDVIEVEASRVGRSRSGVTLARQESGAGDHESSARDATPPVTLNTAKRYEESPDSRSRHRRAPSFRRAPLHKS